MSGKILVDAAEYEYLKEYLELNKHHRDPYAELSEKLTRHMDEDRKSKDDILKKLEELTHKNEANEDFISEITIGFKYVKRFWLGATALMLGLLAAISQIYSMMHNK